MTKNSQNTQKTNGDIFENIVKHLNTKYENMRCCGGRDCTSKNYSMDNLWNKDFSVEKVDSNDKDLSEAPTL